MRSNWNRKWICERTHTHTQHIRQMFRHSKWRTFSNLFGRLSKDDEIIYTKCVRTHERRPHAYRPQEFQQFTRFCVAPEKAWNYEGHTKQRAHARTHALRQVVCDRNMRNRFYSFGKHAFSFHLFEYFFFCFSFVVLKTYVQKYARPHRLPGNGILSDGMCGVREHFDCKHCMTRISFVFALYFLHSFHLLRSMDR